MSPGTRRDEGTPGAGPSALPVEVAPGPDLFLAAVEETSEAVGAIRAVRDGSGAHVGDAVVYLNGTIRRRWLGGVALESVVGADPYALIPMLESLRPLSRWIVETREPHRSLECLSGPGGRSLWIDLRLEPWGDGFIFFSRDVTEEQAAVATAEAAAQQAVRESEARFRLLAENASDIVFRSDLVGVFEWVSPAIEHVLGWTPDEAIGRWVFDYIHPEDRARVAAEGAGVSRGEGASFEARYLRPDGSWRWLSVRSRPIRDAEDRIVGRVGSARDVTAEHEAVDALRHREADLAEAQRMAHVGSYSYRPETGTVEWSAETFRILGLPPRAGLPSQEEQALLLGTDVTSRRRELLERLLRTGEPFEDEFEVARADGALRRLVTRGEPVRDQSGAIVGVRGTVADVTETREAQARLDQASRAEVVGRLAGGIAHDFNNILAAIAGYAELLAGDIPEDDPRRADVEAILEASSRGAALTRRLLEFGRRQPLDPAPLDPVVVVDGLVPMLRSLVPTSMELSVAHGGPVGVIRADRAQLEQSVVNLVLNARDAAAPDGRVSISLDEVVVPDGDPRLRPPAEAGTFVRIAVRDTGTGIDAETLAHVFEPFFTTKSPGKGSGLGLSSVDGFVARSGGFTSVESEPGEGSTFAIHLPVDPAGDAPSAEPGAERSAVVGGTERVVLVEDDPEVRAVVGRMLRELGYSVLVLEIPDRAASVLRTGGEWVDLLITDVVMPGIGGRELVRQVREARPDLPILLISGYVPDEEAGVPAWEGEERVLSKPFRREELAARVREALGDRDGNPGA